MSSTTASKYGYFIKRAQKSKRIRKRLRKVTMLEQLSRDYHQWPSSVNKVYCIRYGQSHRVPAAKRNDWIVRQWIMRSWPLIKYQNDKQNVTFEKRTKKHEFGLSPYLVFEMKDGKKYDFKIEEKNEGIGLKEVYEQSRLIKEFLEDITKKMDPERINFFKGEKDRL